MNKRSIHRDPTIRVVGPGLIRVQCSCGWQTHSIDVVDQESLSTLAGHIMSATAEQMRKDFADAGRTGT